MSVYKYSILRYIPDKQKFQTEDGIERFSNEDSLIVYNNYKKQYSNFMKTKDTNKLQKILNTIVENNNDLYEKQMDYIKGELENKTYQRILERFGTQVFDNKKPGTIKLNTNFLKRQFEQNKQSLLDLTTKSIDEKKQDDFIAVYKNINAQLNKLRGDLFENFLEIFFEGINKNIDDLIKLGEEEVKEVVKNALLKDTKIKTTNIGRSKVIGDVKKMNHTIELKDLYGESSTFTISGGQGKTDLVVRNFAPNSIEEIGFSLKNYQGSSKIDLLNRAKVLSLINDWDISESKKNLAFNGLSARSIYDKQYKLMQKDFFIESLIGLSSENIPAQIFVVNRNTKKNPFLVFSTYDLLFNTDNNFIGNFSEINPINYKGNKGRTLSEFQNFINNLTISVSTAITAVQMQKLIAQKKLG